MFYFIPQNAAFTSSRTAVKERAMNAGTYFTNNIMYYYFKNKI